MSDDDLTIEDVAYVPSIQRRGSTNKYEAVVQAIRDNPGTTKLVRFEDTKTATSRANSIRQLVRNSHTDIADKVYVQVRQTGVYVTLGEPTTGAVPAKKSAGTKKASTTKKAPAKKAATKTASSSSGGAKKRPAKKRPAKKRSSA